MVGGWLVGGWGEIKIIDHLSPAKAETGAELGKKFQSKAQEFFHLFFSFYLTVCYDF